MKGLLLFIYLLCTENEADKAPNICQCIPSTTPGQYLHFLLLSPTLNQALRCSAPTSCNMIMSAISLHLNGDSSWKSILQKCQQQVRGYQHTSGGKLAETSFLVLWWKLEIWTSLRKEEIFFPWWNLVGEIHFLRPVCNRAVSWSHWPKF